MKKLFLIIAFIATAFIATAQTKYYNTGYKWLRFKQVGSSISLQIDSLGNGTWKDIPTVLQVAGGGALTGTQNLYVQWPLRPINDSTFGMVQGDATHDGYLDSLDAKNFLEAYNKYTVSGSYNSGTGTITFTRKDATQWTITGISAGSTDNYFHFQQWEHFMLPAQTTVNGSSFVHASNSGTGSAATNFITPAITGFFGVDQLTTGTTTTGWANLGVGNYPSIGVFTTGVKMRYGAKIYIDTLRNGTNDYRLLVGFGDGNGNGAEAADGAYFLYSSSNAAWEYKTSNNSVRTSNASSVTVAALTSYILEIEWDGAGTINFYINNSLVGSSTTNIPTSLGREFSLGVTITKTAGTIGRTVAVDWMAYAQDY